MLVAPNAPSSMAGHCGTLLHCLCRVLQQQRLRLLLPASCIITCISCSWRYCCQRLKCLQLQGCKVLHDFCRAHRCPIQLPQVRQRRCNGQAVLWLVADRVACR